jgi:hypothetical protein
MNFNCKFCKEKIVEYTQCKTCLDIFCKSCRLYCNDCDVNACQPCQKNMYCSNCKEIICESCPFISINLNKNSTSSSNKYCIKNGCYQDHIYKHSENTTHRFVNYIERLKLQMLYTPNGEAYLEAKEHFETQQEKHNTI